MAHLPGLNKSSHHEDTKKSKRHIDRGLTQIELCSEVGERASQTPHGNDGACRQSFHTAAGIVGRQSINQ